MVRVNKNKLPKNDQDNLFRQLNVILGKLSTSNADIFVQELLGPEERLTIAKRLAVIVMLQEGYSLYRISDTLKISSSTADRIFDNLEDGHYEGLTSLLRQNKTDYASILNVIESIFTVGGIMPSRAGLDRYRGIR